jgi:RNA polymerase sigma factor (TIGR02999 family)
VESDPGSITSLVNGIASGGRSAEEPVLGRLYAELAAMARNRVRSVGLDGEIRTGDLVNEAYLKLFAGSSRGPWQHRAHFFGSAARAMQQVVIELVRRTSVRRKHASRLAVPVELEERTSVPVPAPLVLKLLEELERADPVAAEVVRLRIFAELTMEQVADVLDLPLRTAQRKWTLGRAMAHSWLAGRMDGRERRHG